MEELELKAGQVQTNKFSRMLSASNGDIKTVRAQILAETTLDAVDSFVQTLRRERNVLRTTLANLTDLAPENTYSLRPGSEKFDASAWIKELHKTTMQLQLKEVELEVANDIQKEWFGKSSIND
jgi:hypothetical protein